MAVYFENHLIHISTFCGKMQSWYAQAGVSYSNYYALKG